MDNGVNCHTDISRIVNDNRRISSANAQRRLTGRICSLNHARATSCQDDISVSHYLIGQLQGRNVDPSNDPLRSACLNSSLQHNLGSLNGTLLCSWMWGNDDGIACL